MAKIPQSEITGNKPPKEKKEYTLGIRMDSDTLKRLVQDSRRQGISISENVRNWIEEKLNGNDKHVIKNIGKDKRK